MWKECALKIKALERELLDMRCIFPVDSHLVPFWQRKKGGQVGARLMSPLLYSPGAPFFVGFLTQTFTPALEGAGALCFGTAWFTSSPRLPWGVVSLVLSWSSSYAKAISFQWVEQSFLLLILRRITRSRQSGWSRNWEMFINTCFECVLLERSWRISMCFNSYWGGKGDSLPELHRPSWVEFRGFRFVGNIFQIASFN